MGWVELGDEGVREGGREGVKKRKLRKKRIRLDITWRGGDELG